MQLLDDVAFAAILAAFNEQAADENFSGLLIDYDHFSHNKSLPTEAAGWITELEVRDDGLWFRARWSDKGTSNLQSGCYRFISPVFGGAYTKEGTVRPMRLDRAGLTNAPNFKTLRPLSNRAKEQQKTKPKETPMKKLLALLGLSEDASEDSAISKVKALQAKQADTAKLENRATSAESELKTLKAATLKSEADAFCTEHDARIENREAVHAQFLKDPDGTKALFAGLKEGAEHVTLHNRAKNQPGKTKVVAEKTNADALEGKVQEFMSSNRCKYGQAFDAVSRAHPELLTEEPKTDD